jgi:hypothetical protein
LANQLSIAHQEKREILETYHELRAQAQRKLDACRDKHDGLISRLNTRNDENEVCFMFWIFGFLFDCLLKNFQKLPR